MALERAFPGLFRHYPRLLKPACTNPMFFGHLEPLLNLDCVDSIHLELQKNKLSCIVSGMSKDINSAG